MKTKNKTALYSKKWIYNSLFLGIIIIGSIQSIFSHGTVTDPPSRVWVCYNEIIANASNPMPESPACLSAFLAYGSQAFYDWNEVARMDADGKHQTIITDGNLASAGRVDKYGGLDQVRDDWLTTAVSPGPFTLTWTNTAPHETLYYRVYITKIGWTPDQPLTWDNLDLLVETDPRPSAATDLVDVVLPQRSGKHVLFSVWQRSLSAEAFYATSDVDFGNGVVIDVAPEANFTTDNGICGGSEVLFDASDSFDANGDELTYTWSFGDGNTAKGVQVNHVFAAGLDNSMVTLTVSDKEFSTAITETVSLIKDENCSELVCSFDAPRANALPSINSSYDTLFVIGKRAPNLENITKFTINWDGSGLYQFDFNLNVSPYYGGFSSATHTFGQASPQITLEGTNIEGLDGDYFVTIHEGNFVLASISGGYTIYFSKTDTAPECDDAPVTTEKLRGGTLTDSLPDNEKFEFIIADGTADYVSSITLEGNIGDTTQWLVTDQSGVILGLPATVESFDFDQVDSSIIDGEERLFIYNLSYNGTITGLNLGASTISIKGDYELSNAIEVYVTAKGTNPGSANCKFGTPRSTLLPPLYYRSYNRDQKGSITVIGKNGPDLSSWRKLDLAYANGELSRLYYEEWFDKGNAKIELAPDHTEHTFDKVNPELTLSDTGIANLDGSYYVNIAENEVGRDFQDFVMVSKTGDFSIYFTYSKNAPDCNQTSPISPTLSINDNELQNGALVKQNYPNPFSENTTIEYSLKQKSSVSLKIYNIKGQLVKTINENEKGAGNHSLNFDLTNQTNGIYIYVFETENGKYIKRMVLQK